MSGTRDENIDFLIGKLKYFKTRQLKLTYLIGLAFEADLLEQLHNVLHVEQLPIQVFVLRYHSELILGSYTPVD